MWNSPCGPWLYFLLCGFLELLVLSIWSSRGISSFVVFSCPNLHQTSWLTHLPEYWNSPPIWPIGSQMQQAHSQTHYFAHIPTPVFHSSIKMGKYGPLPLFSSSKYLSNLYFMPGKMPGSSNRTMNMTELYYFSAILSLPPRLPTSTSTTPRQFRSFWSYLLLKCSLILPLFLSPPLPTTVSHLQAWPVVLLSENR